MGSRKLAKRENPQNRASEHCRRFPAPGAPGTVHLPGCMADAIPSMFDGVARQSPLSADASDSDFAGTAPEGVCYVLVGHALSDMHVNNGIRGCAGCTASAVRCESHAAGSCWFMQPSQTGPARHTNELLYSLNDFEVFLVFTFCRSLKVASKLQPAIAQKQTSALADNHSCVSSN